MCTTKMICHTLTVQRHSGARKSQTKLKRKFKHRIYNLGNNNPEVLMNFINKIEMTIGKKAKKNYLPMQPGDVKETFAEITESTKDLKFKPKTNIDKGIPTFVNWYKKYFKI